MDSMPRLLYLTSKLGKDIGKFPRDLRRFIPNVELYETVAKDGLEATAAQFNLPVPQLRKLYDRGKTGGKQARLSEFRILISQEVMDNALLEDLPTAKRLDVLASLQRYVQNSEASIIETDESSMVWDDKKVWESIPKWETGFTPLDVSLQGGVYQGILMLMARPGTGKTSMMLSIMEQIKLRHPDWDMLFFEQEIPMKLMMARAEPVRRRAPFTETDLMVCGNISIEEIKKRLEAHGSDRPRVVFIDSPDAMPGLVSDGRRIELGHIYRELVKIKERSELVVVASQPNRASTQGGELTLTSPAESWEKVWFVDMMVAFWQTGIRGANQQMHLRTLKNRFGMSGGVAAFDYNLEDLTFDDSLLVDDEEAWS